MNLLILGSEEGYYVKQLANAGCARSWSVKISPFSGLKQELESGRMDLFTEEGMNIHQFDAVLVRTMPASSLEKVIFRMDALYHLELQGLRVLNPVKSLECAIDKWLTLLRLNQHQLSVPDTIVCETVEQGMMAFEQLQRHVVIKPLFGAEGRGMIEVDHPEIAWRVFKTLEQTQSVIYLQRFIRHPGYDIRVLVFGDQILGAIKRFSQHDFRTNTSQQGIAVQHSLTSEESRVALKAASATGTVFAGVDLIYDETGKLYVLEVNGVPGWKGFQQATGIDVAQSCLDYLDDWVRKM